MTADCLKLTSYFGERQRSGGAFVADALIELYGRQEIAASVLLRGTEGFGLKHHLRTDRSLSLSEDLPLIAIAVDTRPRIEAILGQATELNPAGLVTLERARLLTDVTAPLSLPDDLREAAKLTVYLGRQERTGRGPAFIAVCDLLYRHGIDGATALPGTDEHGMALWQKLMVYTSEATRHHGQPIHRAIVRRLRSAGISGATTQRGIWGFHGDHAPHGDRLLQLGRHVPAVTIVIDTPERMPAAFSVFDEFTSERGLVTSETIPAMRASSGDRQRGGTRLASHHLRGPRSTGIRPAEGRRRPPRERR